MRIWDLPPSILCRQHLLGEHRELHGLWNILTQGKKGYSQHPETLRWVGKEAALWWRHADLVTEMKQRGYAHNSPLRGNDDAYRLVNQTDYIDTPEQQLAILKEKGCDCDTEGVRQ